MTGTEKTALIDKIEKTIKQVEAISDIGYIIAVGDKFVVPSDSNSGWRLSDFPEVSIKYEDVARDLLDDISESYVLCNLEKSSDVKKNTIKNLLETLKLLNHEQ